MQHVEISNLASVTVAQENYKDVTNVDDDAQERAFQETKDNVKDFTQKVCS